jgi:hypothetical protein
VLNAMITRSHVLYSALLAVPPVGQSVARPCQPKAVCIWETARAAPLAEMGPPDPPMCRCWASRNHLYAGRRAAIQLMVFLMLSTPSHARSAVERWQSLYLCARWCCDARHTPFDALCNTRASENEYREARDAAAGLLCRLRLAYRLGSRRI